MGVWGSAAVVPADWGAFLAVDFPYASAAAVQVARLVPVAVVKGKLPADDE